MNNILSHRCSVDPYLFENFETSDGDFLKAKFRAFKFPQSPFVLFKVVDLRYILTAGASNFSFQGSVNVCLDSCLGVQCSNGQRGFGRRRREVSDAADPNKVASLSFTYLQQNH